MPHEFKDDTLDDIKHRDILNLEVFLNKKTRIYKKFDSLAAAHAFQGQQLCDILKKLGIEVARAAIDMSYDIDKKMEEKNIKVESRIYNEPQPDRLDSDPDEWRSGMYVYKDNEIAGFVGFPTFNQRIFMGYQVLCTKDI